MHEWSILCTALAQAICIKGHTPFILSSVYVYEMLKHVDIFFPLIVFTSHLYLIYVDLILLTKLNNEAKIKMLDEAPGP